MSAAAPGDPQSDKEQASREASTADCPEEQSPASAFQLSICLSISALSLAMRLRSPTFDLLPEQRCLILKLAGPVEELLSTE